MSQAITQGGGCLTLHSKWKSAFDDSEASDNETEKKGENFASPKHAKGAGGETGSREQQVAATDPGSPSLRFILTYPTHCYNKYLCYNFSVVTTNIWILQPICSVTTVVLK